MASTAPSSTPERETRRTRNAKQARAVNSLQFRRPLPQNAGLGAGVFPSGQHIKGTFRPRRPEGTADATSESQQTPQGTGQTRKPLISRVGVGPLATRGAAPPPGPMVRAPSKLRITRNAGPSRAGGPNLRGRGPSSTSSREAAPKRREKKASSKAAPAQGQQDVDPGQAMPDGMVQHLLRLQRKEWDRVPYVPRYAPGSFEANELIHRGRELFRGEAPPVKVWGPLEKRLKIVGMHGAEAHLQVRRVLDGDDKPFGKEDAMEKKYRQKDAPQVVPQVA